MSIIGRTSGFAILLMLVAGVATPARAHDCGTVSSCPPEPADGVPTSECHADCTEADFREAVDVVNNCGGYRTIRFAGPHCLGDVGNPTVIDMNQANPTCNGTCVGGVRPGRPCSGLSVCRPASCGPTGIGVGNAVCLFGNRITIDGEHKILFNYVPPTGTGNALDGACCSGQCGNTNYQSALFTFAPDAGVETHDNTVMNFAMQYFPEGIHINKGRRHRVLNVVNKRICEDAITIDDPENPPGPLLDTAFDIVVSGNTLVGSQPADANHKCVLEVANPNGPSTFVMNHLCGLDKAIQVWGGTSTISDNFIDTISVPVLVKGGDHVIQRNHSWGLLPGCAEYSVPGADACLQNNPDPPYNVPASRQCDDTCQAYEVSGGSADFRDNTIAYCKFGISTLGDSDYGTVGDGTASGNHISFSPVAALYSRAGSSLYAHDNIIKNAGCFTDSQAERGAVVARDGSVINLTSHNSVCQDATLPDVYNAASDVVAPGNCWGDEASPTRSFLGDGTTTADSPPATCNQSGFQICGCPARPLTGCREPTELEESTLKVSANGSGSFKWQWKKGEASTAADFGTPSSQSTYLMCLYETPPSGVPRLVFEASARAGGNCNGRACWSQYVTADQTLRKWVYKDPHATNDGVRGVRLFPGIATRAKIDVQGRGPYLHLPASLGLQGKLIAQLSNTTPHACWEASYSGGSRSTTKLSARSDAPTP